MTKKKMNNTPYSILTKEIMINQEHDGSVPENCVCPVCNVHMNKIKRSRPLDTHQEHNAFSSDGIKERRCPVDRLQTIRSNLHPAIENSSERLQKLSSYPILDSEPPLNGLHFSNSLCRSPHSKGNKIKDFTTQSMYVVETTDKHNEVFQYHNNLGIWEENENSIAQEDLKNIDKFKYTPIKKFDLMIRQPPVHRQRKILPTVPPKPFISTNSMPKICELSSIANGHLNNENQIDKNHMEIPNQNIRDNHARMSIPFETRDTFEVVKLSKEPHEKETFMLNKEFIKEKEINKNGHMSPKTELIINGIVIHNKEQEKLSDKNCLKINYKSKEKVGDIKNNTPVLHVNLWKNHSLNSSTELILENAQKNLKSPFEKTLNKNNEQDLLTDEQNKLAYNSLFSVTDTPKQKVKSELHSSLRPSLFSNMPPYIRFSSHDVKGESFPLPLQKLLKWKLSTITPIVVRRTIQNSGFKLVRKSNDWVGTWGKHMKSLCFKTIREQQKLNHFPGTFQIGRKDRLWKNLHRLMLKYGQDEFGFIPTSYILPQEARILRQVWEKNNEDKWIVKPPASARGSGIRVISKWNQIPKKVPLVVQRYIDNPYLINDTKFDLRLYVLVTSVNPLRLYLYDNGLVRFASVKYSSDLTTISDRYMHLTNYSINRLSSQYTQNEDADACQGHKWTLRSLWTYMEKERKVDVKKLWDSLTDLVVKTLISGESPMSQLCRSNLSNRYNSYELFGIDVLFDEFLKPWILEVNISPSLHSSSPLDLAVKGPLVKDLMNMVGYHIPNKMSTSTHNTLLKMLGINSPLCYDKRLYTFNLSAKEQEKQECYKNIESREEYIDSILKELLPDDVRHLIIFEDELTQIGSFQKIFPTTSSHEYHEFFEGPRYYNMLFDAWECKYSEKRDEGIAVLEKLCKLQVHLEVPEVDEEESKTCDILQNTQMEVEKMFDKSCNEKISDHHQAVISHFSMSAAERRHMVYTSITMSDEGDWISDDYPFDDDSASATNHSMVS